MLDIGDALEVVLDLRPGLLDVELGHAGEVGVDELAHVQARDGRGELNRVVQLPVDELAALARELSRILIESVATGELPMSRIEREVGLDRVRAAAATADDALLPLDQQQLEVLAGSHGYLRPAVHALLGSSE